jgi:hypothetical protein
VKAPRFRIAWVMVAVAIAALDFWATRELLDPRAPQIGMLLLSGALPTANILAIGLLVAHQRPGNRPFILGFEVFGAFALVLFVILATPIRGELVTDYYLLPVLELSQAYVKDRLLIFRLTGIFVVVVILVVPQVLFALIGGFLSRRFKITIARR